MTGLLLRASLAAAVLLFASAATASADQQYVSGNGQVVHTRLAPVVMHRAFPPYGGVHVHQRSMKSQSVGRRGR
ncbi:hypothetical protein Psta_2003 [Pirellula staleyi DSM 6068]|uniref:Uncharacterized protein n=1 Tax=Pirellula staleyi (strain ATCC 27377 / DSM 6068 / ICPB 4128) TaxID=530564 RepID=D2R0S9_PIRSD|nr:hypothetical protein [Pirellula staleyi]ADB16677.1 hypothetical protein Psta_2003 [Pirellula staleyi DSM 6068]